MKLWKRIRDLLSTEIPISWEDTVTNSVEAGQQVLELATVLNENKDAKELSSIIGRIS